MRTRLKLLTVGVVFVTAAVAGCTTSTPEPVAPAGATQDDALKVVPPPMVSVAPLALYTPAPMPEPPPPAAATTPKKPKPNKPKKPRAAPAAKSTPGDLSRRLEILTYKLDL